MLIKIKLGRSTSFVPHPVSRASNIRYVSGLWPPGQIVNFDCCNKSVHCSDETLLPLRWTRISGCSNAKAFVTLMAVSLRGELRAVTCPNIILSEKGQIEMSPENGIHCLLNNPGECCPEYESGRSTWIAIIGTFRTQELHPFQIIIKILAATPALWIIIHTAEALLSPSRGYLVNSRYLSYKAG